MDRINEIQARLAAIATEIETATGDVLTNLETEARTLTEELNGIRDEAQRRQAVRASIAAGAGTPIQSPLAGKVVSLDVKPGTAVKEGDQVLTLEAMKMNTVIYAPAAGTVTSFCVAPGDTVAENQPLAYLG